MRISRSWILVAAAATIALPQPVAAQFVAATEIEVGGGRDQLTEPHADWNDVYLRLLRRFPNGSILYGEATRTDRFGVADSRARAGAGFPLTNSWSTLLEAAFSPTAEVLPSYALLADVYRTMGGGWQLGVGGRLSDYESGLVKIGAFIADYYTGDYRLGYRLEVDFIGDESAPAHAGLLSRYYGDGSSFVIRIGTGRSVERTSADSLRVADVREVAGWGTHWLSRAVGVSYGASYDELAEVFDRVRVEGGVRVRI